MPIADCPAFKDGCPYASGDQMAKAIDLAKKECPEFKNGCPYKGKNPEDVVKSFHANEGAMLKMAEMCPYFKSGCPFGADEAMKGKLSECPVFKSGCPFSTPIDDLAKKCPAFKDGKCPYAGEASKYKEALKKCPEFQGGCPFKDETSVEHVAKHIFLHGSVDSLGDLAKKCPAFKDGKCPFETESKKLKEAHSKCPAFSSGCPFRASIPAAASSSTEEANPHGKDKSNVLPPGMTQEYLESVCPHFKKQKKDE